MPWILMQIKTVNLAKMSCRNLSLRSSNDMVAKLAVAKVAVKVVAKVALEAVKEEAVKEEAAPEQEGAGQAVVVVVLAAVESDLVDLIRNHSPTR